MRVRFSPSAPSEKLILLHGWGQQKKTWLPLIDMFSQFIECVCFDLPGFGDTKAPKTPWSVRDYANWVASSIKAYKQPCILLGHSFGGRIAVELASREETNVTKLVLFGAPCLYRPSVKIRLIKKLVTIAKGLRIPYRGLGSSEYQHSLTAGMGETFKIVAGTDQEQQLQCLQTPTLLLRGEHDTAVSNRTYQEMLRMIKSNKKQLVTLPHVSHNSHLQNQYLFYGVIKRFVQGEIISI